VTRDVAQAEERAANAETRVQGSLPSSIIFMAAFGTY
jgi:hypothetical protein